MRLSLFFLILCAALCLGLGHRNSTSTAEIEIQEPNERPWRKVLDLRGHWLFQIGDNPAWADPRFDDSDWDEIFVPSTWEDEGYPGYNGHAWYRLHVHLDANLKGVPLFLRLGRIDDVDQVFVNGFVVGSEGAFPPDYRTAYNVDRVYRLPENVLRLGKDNVIAIRVYDAEQAGGIVEGQVGIFERTDYPQMAVDLAGSWRFRPGDDLRWRSEKLSDKDWYDIQVPAKWEPQGFEELDGMAWYRVRFYVPNRYERDDLMLLLGLIDDLDEAYLNGVPIGHTGDLRRRQQRGDEYRQLRAYSIPEGVLRTGTYNTLAVRVYDGYLDGGIYAGPVGLVTRDAYRRWRPDSETSFLQFLRDFFSDWE